MSLAALAAVVAAAGATALAFPAPAAVAASPLRPRWSPPTADELLAGPCSARIAAGLALIGALPALGVVPALAVAVVVLALVPGLRDAAAERGRQRIDTGWQSALVAIAAALQAGSPTPAALRRGAAAAEAAGSPEACSTLTAAAASADLGGDAVGALAEHCRDGPGAQLAAALALAGEVGAPPALLAVRLAGSVAARARAARAATVALAGARTTTRLLAALPLAGLGLAAAFGASAPAYLLDTPTGHACLLVAAGFEAAGLTWTRRLLAAAIGS